MSQKSSYASNIFDPVINGFSTHEVRSHFQIFDYSIFIFVIRGYILWFSNTSHVESLDRFRKLVVDKVITELYILKNHPKENNIKIKYANKSIQKMGMGDATTYVYQFMMMKMTVMTQR